MSNADMPVNPLTEEQIDICERGRGYEGLSKREHFAVMAMQGLLAAGDHFRASKVDIASTAIDYADALLEELGSERD